MIATQPLLRSGRRAAALRSRLLGCLAPLVVAATLQPGPPVARDGGGGHGGCGHGGGGGRDRFGGGHERAGGGYHHVYGDGARTPALRHNISRNDYNRATNGGRDRFDANRLGWGNRNWNDGDSRGNNWRGENWGYDNWNNRWNGGWNNNWNNGGFWGDRPWSYGCQFLCLGPGGLGYGGGDHGSGG